MLARLAFGNIRRTLRDYAIYAITLVLGVAVFYAFNTITVQATFLDGNVSDELTGVRDMLVTITVALALVMGFLMVYANNYLMRRRTRELALYQVLGMRPGQVNVILVIETLAVAAVSLVVGLALGMLLSQLMVFATASLFRTNVSHFRFFLSADALRLTVGCFVLMFLVMMVFNTTSLRRVRLVDLMGADKRNEGSHARSLPGSIVLFVAGLALVAIAYVRLTRHGIPGFGTDGNAGRPDFFLTTALVTVGTVVLFFGLAGTATGVLSRIRGFWWRDLRMFTVRQIASRVNTASMSMAVIAMLLFLAITSVTGGMAVVQVVNEEVEEATSFSASVMGVGFPQDSAQAPDLAAAMRRVGCDPAELGDYAQLDVRFPIALDSGGVSLGPDGEPVATYSDVQEVGGFTLEDIARATGQELTSDVADYDAAETPHIVSLSQYNACLALKGMDAVQLDAGHYLMLQGSDANTVPLLNEALEQGYAFTVAGEHLTPARSSVVTGEGSWLSDGGGSFGALCLLVVPDDVAARCALCEPVLNLRYGSGVDVQEADALLRGDQLDRSLTEELGFSVLTYVATNIRQSSVSTRGLVTYLAIYIGFVLVVACAAILAIQQLAAASDAVPNYRTLGELGCPERLIYGSLRTQQVVAFAAPLVVGIAHSVCALSVVMKGLRQAGLTSVAGSALTIGVIFVVVYGGYLAFTYRTARGVVRAGLRSARRAL